MFWNWNEKWCKKYKWQWSCITWSKSTVALPEEMKLFWSHNGGCWSVRSPSNENEDETVLHYWLSSTWRDAKTCISLVFYPLPLSPVMGSHPPAKGVYMTALPTFLLAPSLVMTAIFQQLCLTESWMSKAVGETSRRKELQGHKVLSRHL